MAKATPPNDKTPTVAPLRKPKHGNGALRVGNPGNKGGGKTKEEFKTILQTLASKEETVRALEQLLMAPDHPAFLGALKYATEHGYGKPAQAVEHSGEIGLNVAYQREGRRG
jgi:hypothetical protein